MIYEKELMRYKRTNFQHTKGLQIFQHVKAGQPQVSTLYLIRQQIIHFTKSIHGFSYIWEKDFGLKVRLLWFFVVVGSIISCVLMYMALASQHHKQQVKTIVASSQMPIYAIYFPAVALCPWEHVNWSRYKAAEEKFLPHNANQNEKDVFYDILRVINDMNLVQLDSSALLQNRTLPPAIQNISISSLAKFMSFRCDDLFAECIYDQAKYDCCKLFVAESTERGICLVFNSMVSEDSRKKKITGESYPWKNRKAGEGTGLQFTIRVNQTYQREQDAKNFGFHVMIKGSEEWSEPRVHCFLPNRISYLSIIPIVSETLENTRHLDPRARNCLFEDEKSHLYDRIEGLQFNKLNCITKCQQKSFIKTCNCNLSWFFPKVGTRECTVEDFKCIYANRDIFTYTKSPLQDKYINDSRRGVTCDCVSSCFTVTVLNSLRANVLYNPNVSNPIIQGNIYIGQAVLTKYEINLYCNLFDLIAQFGGILGLCLGASVISLVEVAYSALKIFVILLLKLFQKRKINPQLSKGKSNKK